MLQGLCELDRVVERRLRCGVADALVQLLLRLLERGRVASDDLAAVQAVLEEVLRQHEELAGEHHDEVGAVTDLRLLHLRRHHEQLRCRVLHLQLLDDGRGVVGDEELLKMVDHHLVHAVGAKRGAHAAAQLLRRLDVLVGRLLQTGQLLVPLLEHAIHAHARRLHRQRADGSGECEGRHALASAELRYSRRRPVGLTFAPHGRKPHCCHCCAGAAEEARAAAHRQIPRHVAERRLRVVPGARTQGQHGQRGRLRPQARRRAGPSQRARQRTFGAPRKWIDRWLGWFCLLPPARERDWR